MRRSFVSLAALAVLALCLTGPAPVALAGAGDTIDVMTQNQYLGADLTGVITAPDFPTFLMEAEAALGQIAANNFPERAAKLAEEIADRLPALVGVQEAFNFTFDPDGAGPIPPQNGPPPFRDMLQDTLDALAALGEVYVPVASVQNLNVSVPGINVPGLGVVTLGVTDRDVILARADIAPFVAPVPFSAACARPSADGGPGCNYQVVASVNLPTPGGPVPLNIERGWVGVDVLIDGSIFRFVNTHLEVQMPSPDPASPAIQAFQAQELIATLAAFPAAPGTRLIVVGDINSSPVDPVITLPGPFVIVPPYTQFAGAGYTDAWSDANPGQPGFSCCQDEDLRNHSSSLDERIDMIFSWVPPDKSKKARVLGAKQKDKTDLQGLWPSDHGAVAIQLEFE